MEQRSALADFLQSRRARLRPEEAGLVNYGERRRVPGLRREELAQLAGVSVSYYTRLEQGQSQHASDAVLDAIARTLRLDEQEREYLLRLARPGRPPHRAPRPEQVRPGLRTLIESMPDTPAVVLGRSTDALAWNTLGHALVAGHLDVTSPTRPADRPNMTRLVFLDAHTRELYVDWKGKARSAVAHLRMLAGQSPHDPRLAALVGELTMHSNEFAALWAAHPVRHCEPSPRAFHHPLVGELTLWQETLRPLADDDQMVVLYGAVPGSASEAGLRLLAALASGGAGSATGNATGTAERETVGHHGAGARGGGWYAGTSTFQGTSSVSTRTNTSSPG